MLFLLFIGMLGSFERFLRRKTYSSSLISSSEFYGTRETLKSKQKNLKQQGKCNKPKAADALNDTDIEKLFEASELGTKTPTSLLNSLWLNNTLHFGVRGGGEEHRNIQWGDIVLNYDQVLGLEYLEYSERQTKTRTGEDLRNVRGPKPRMNQNPSILDRCPVHIYKTYQDKRPGDFSDPSHPFYLATVTNVHAPAPDQRWFLRAPVGVHKLSQLMKKMAGRANLPNLATKRITNTSVRKYLCQKLVENNIPDTQAVHISGHKNPNSLNNYRSLRNEQKCTMSTLLSTNLSNISPVCSVPQSSSRTGNELIPTTKSVRPSISLPLGHRTSVLNNTENISLPQKSQGNPYGNIFSGAFIHGGNFSINVKYNMPQIRSRQPVAKKNAE